MRNPRLYNQTVTVYVPLRDRTASNSVTYVRVVVPGCHWEENSIAITRMTGALVTSNVEIYLPRGKDDAVPKQITPDEWAQLSVNNIDIANIEKYYALALTGVVDAIWIQPRLFRGILDYRFGWGTSTVISTEMNNLARDYGLITLRDINYNWYGDRKLHHIVVR